MANYYCLQGGLLVFLLIVTWPHEGSADVSFNDNYYITWGYNHAQLLNQGAKLQLTLDQSSGAGFESKAMFGLFVDDVPIRVFKNMPDSGVSYPSQPMHVTGSLWNAEGWASGGIPTDWSQGPFKAYFQGFDVTGCPLEDANNRQACYASDLWWNGKNYWQLNPQQQALLDRSRKSYMTYDYCTDKSRYPQPPPECQYNH
ncbi:putative xyloglucan endotransglucosylase/hydrolase protein 1-like [Tripterygium wilfordii]|uniref:xyloglucan:xyloglucosyl transferase n=1 Tax=Tripterygium wilfordii TaxID=458696 RepID=A0A7J7DC95_TRIWF|nr:putative xyloglucan endotransglucosylase/hydrolase protein 1-like [Tripterygium wilfordii]